MQPSCAFAVSPIRYCSCVQVTADPCNISPPPLNVLRFKGEKVLVCVRGVTMLSSETGDRNQNQLQLWGIGSRRFTGGNSEWGKRQTNGRGRTEGAGGDVDGRGGCELSEASVKISGPPGDQLSSITRRIQLQREAEGIQHQSVTRRQRGSEGGVGGRLGTG